MSKLVIACTPCQPIDADIFFNEIPYLFGAFEHAATLQDAEMIRSDMSRWYTREHIVIVDHDDVEALFVGGVQ